jgi:hypothetical protein
LRDRGLAVGSSETGRAIAGPVNAGATVEAKDSIARVDDDGRFAVGASESCRTDACAIVTGATVEAGHVLAGIGLAADGTDDE